MSLIFVVIHRMIHLKLDITHFLMNKNKKQINQGIVVFEEDLRNKYSFDELLLIYVHNDVSFHEEAKNQVFIDIDHFVLDAPEYSVPFQYLAS